jgi:hypothetical protein
MGKAAECRFEEVEALEVIEATGYRVSRRAMFLRTDEVQTVHRFAALKLCHCLCRLQRWIEHRNAVVQKRTGWL